MKKKPYINKRIDDSRIKEGDYVLDYACGPGLFTLPIAVKVGKKGKVAAADIQPLAGEMIRKKAGKLNWSNIEFYQTDCVLPLPNDQIDVAVLFDCIHIFKTPELILTEIFRVLRKDGILSVDIHHISKKKGMQIIASTKLFEIEENPNGSTLLLYKPRK